MKKKKKKQHFTILQPIFYILLIKRLTTNDSTEMNFKLLLQKMLSSLFFHILSPDRFHASSCLHSGRLDFKHYDYWAPLSLFNSDLMQINSSDCYGPWGEKDNKLLLISLYGNKVRAYRLILASPGWRERRSQRMFAFVLLINPGHYSAYIQAHVNTFKLGVNQGLG